MASAGPETCRKPSRSYHSHQRRSEGEITEAQVPGHWIPSIPSFLTSAAEAEASGITGRSTAEYEVTNPLNPNVKSGGGRAEAEEEIFSACLASGCSGQTIVGRALVGFLRTEWH